MSAPENELTVKIKELLRIKSKNSHPYIRKVLDQYRKMQFDNAFLNN